MAMISKDLWVTRGTIALPGKTIPIWGLWTFGGEAQVPGPIIEGEAGDIIQIRLYNDFLNVSPIGEPVSLIFPGQENVRVEKWPGGVLQLVQPQYSGGRLISLTNFIEKGKFYEPKALFYQIEAQKPGIYLYESGTYPEKQIQMGCYGAIVVRPVGYKISDHPNYRTAYGAGTGSSYDVEKILILGEMDSIMHEDVVPNVYYDMLKYKPDYWVINGRVYPDTLNDDHGSSQPYGSKISCRLGDRVLLRLLNAGFQEHTFYLGGLVGRVVAEDSFPLIHSGGDGSYEKMEMTLGAGQSVDVIMTPTTEGEFYLYAREYNHLVNNEQFPGGMKTKMEVMP